MGDLLARRGVPEYRQKKARDMKHATLLLFVISCFDSSDASPLFLLGFLTFVATRCLFPSLCPFYFLFRTYSRGLRQLNELIPPSMIDKSVVYRLLKTNKRKQGWAQERERERE